MGKPMIAYAITVLHTRPTFPANIEFLKIFHIKSSGDEKTLQDIFARAFHEAHPEWVVKEVNVTRE